MDTVKIGLFAYQNCISSGLLSALDFFRVANLLSGKRRFEVKILGETKGDVVCAHGQVVNATAKISEFDPDVIIVPGVWTETSQELNAPSIVKNLGSVRRTTLVCSYCTGVHFHAQTGRLRRKPATGTWWLSESLKKTFPETSWEFNRTFVREGRDITAAGANGYFPILEALIKTYSDQRTLKEVQKYLLTPPILASNDPFHFIEKSSSKLEVKVKRIVAKTPARGLTVEHVAQELGLSSKTLSRHLLEQTKLTPAKYVRLLKFKEAAELMLTSNLSVSSICEKLGFDDESNFRRGFKNSIGLTPGEYVKKFKRTFPR